MVDMVKVRTLRQHDGPDGQKWQGDEYNRTKVDADHLERLGVVKILSAVKAEEPAENKAEPAPENKSEPTAETSKKARKEASK